MKLKKGDKLYCEDEVQMVVDYGYDGENEFPVYTGKEKVIREVEIDNELKTIVAGYAGIYDRIRFDIDQVSDGFESKDVKGLKFYKDDEVLKVKYHLYRLKEAADELINEIVLKKKDVKLTLDSIIEDLSDSVERMP